MIIIFDLDGTLANIDHRRNLILKNTPDWDKYVEKKKIDWEKFYKECVNDTPNVPVVEIYKTLQQTGKYTMVILSGRSEVVRKETEEWLKRNYIEYDLLVMRPDKDYTPDEDLKRSWLKKLQETEMVCCVFDDRKKVVNMWRKEGLTCFQVAEGEY